MIPPGPRCAHRPDGPAMRRGSGAGMLSTVSESPPTVPASVIPGSGAVQVPSPGDSPPTQVRTIGNSVHNSRLRPGARGIVPRRTALRTVRVDSNGPGRLAAGRNPSTPEPDSEAQPLAASMPGSASGIAYY